MAGMSTSPEDVDPARSNRRKACDLCFTKKIKCDMLKPVCSNCKLYHADCHTSIVRKKPNPSRARQAARQKDDENITKEPLEDRLARIEKQLQQVLDAARKPESQAGSRSTTNHPESQTGSSSTTNQQDAISTSDTTEDIIGGHFQMDDSAIQDWRFDPVDPSMYRGPQPDNLTLPPLEEILPVIDHYFATYNTLIPLFDQPTFMRMLQGWYTQRAPRDRATWAAIQMVLAIGYRTPSPLDRETTTLQIQQANECLRNAQTVVSELVTRDEDLLGLQILLGIVMLFQNSRDAKPASVIIGTAVRLAQRLQLHSSEAAGFFSADEAEQRNRVFWIAYTLDKDISLRATTPSAQVDHDIDVALPSQSPKDGAGLVWTKDGQTSFNYHRMRVELAHIQGKVYDLLYSNRAVRIKGAVERQQRVARLQGMLDRWYARVPVMFQIDHVASMVGPGELLQLTKMHHAFLLAEVMTHGIYSHDANWIKRISSFSRTIMRDMMTSCKKFSASGNRDQPPPLPDGWNKCVELSRGCMKLFQEAYPTECLVWQCSCAHFSALIIILANMGIFPSHTSVSLDRHLAATAVHLFDKLLEVIDSQPFRNLRVIVGELKTNADAAVNATQHSITDGERSRQEQDSVLLDTGNLPPNALDFLPLDFEVEGGGTFGGGPFGLEAMGEPFDEVDSHSSRELVGRDMLQGIDFTTFMG